MRRILYILITMLFFAVSQSAFALDAGDVPSVARKYGKRNLVKNPHFSDSLKHYKSQYRKYKNGGMQEGTYIITKDPKENMRKYASQRDHTQDSAALMYFVNSSTHSQDTSIILEQTIHNVWKGKNYFLHFWASPNSDKNISAFRVKVNDRIVYDSLQIMYLGNGFWVRHEVIIDSLESDSINFSFYTLLREMVGNDLALDDFFISRLCDDKFDIAKKLKKCHGELMSYKIDFPHQGTHFRLEWNPDSEINLTDKYTPIFLNEESKYFHYTIYDDEYLCDYTDSILVEVVNEIAVSKIEASNNAVIYPCKPVTLKVPAGYSYLWSTGDTTNKISVGSPGEYKVRVSASPSCYKDFSVKVETFIPQISFSMDSISTPSGREVQMPIRYTLHNYNADAGDVIRLSIYVQYIKSMFLPNELSRYKYLSSGKYEVLRIGLPKIKEGENVFYLNGTALFGEAECTVLDISPADECMSEYKIDYQYGKLCLSDLCTTPTVRLISDAPEAKLSHKIVGDNLVIEYDFASEATREVKVFDEMGRIVARCTISQRKGEATISISALPIGMYFYEIIADKPLRNRFIKY